MRSKKQTNRKKGLSGSGMPLANVQSQKMKWTKCVSGLAEEQKIRDAGQFPRRPLAKAAAESSAGVWEPLGGV